ncbi:MAG: MATE family efflux transporter [Defluviitaleaceae bacterium]|nr:MATE family efflux transporter [Defluviitaleaceae bacterium]
MRLAPPVALQEMLNALVNILSTIMIGRAMGLNEVTAVGIANQIFMSYTLLVAGIVGGCAVFIGQYHGKGDGESVYKVLGIGFTFTMSVTVAVAIMAVFFPQVLVGVFTRNPYVIELGAGFIRVAVISYFLFAIVFLRNSAIRAMGNTRLPMITTGVALCFSFTFHYIFIFVLGAPLYMIAFVPVIARTAEITLQQFFIRRYNIPIRAPIKRYFEYDLPYVKRFFKITIFIVLTMLLRSVAVSGYMVAYGFMDIYSQGAIQISMALLQLLQLSAASIGVSTGIIMSNTLGAGNIELAIRYSRKCLLFGIVMSSVMGGMFLMFSPLIVAFYMVEPQVEFYVIRILTVASFGMILRTINFTCLGGILRGGGDTRFSFLLVLVAVLVFGLPLSFAGAVLWQLPIYLVVALVYTEELVKAIFGLRRVFSNKWANRLV